MNRRLAVCVGMLESPSRPATRTAVILTATLFAACNLIGGRLGDECSTESDCASAYSCVKCSIRNACYFGDMLDNDSSFERVCGVYGAGKPTDHRYGGGGSGGSGSTSCNASSAWTCSYDGQATPMCQYACSLSGSQRAQTCQSLAGMLTSGNAGSCCPVCR